jgi:mannose-6-phosphate isomerase-like protein (cupin superfamily)
VGSRYTHKNIAQVDDAAPAFGLAENQEARFASAAYDAEDTGFSFHRVKPGRRQGFGHRHDAAEEVYFVVSGGGRMKLDDDILELVEHDVIRVSPGVTRAFEAGDDGLEVLAFGVRHPEDKGELIMGWWQD